jgi:mono/diheme cytochrome c family protein
MNQLILSLVLLFVSLTAAAQNLDVITLKGPSQLTLLEMKSKLKNYTITVDDPTYKSTKVYDAFLLQDVLQLAGAEPSQTADEMVFTAVDGYSPNMPFGAVKDHKGYIAYQEHSTPGRFALIDHGKAKISPWPFYLVWEEGIKVGPAIPWPYQLIKIEVVDWKQKYPLVIPTGKAAGSPEMRGFALFKAECIRCHSINLQGGDLGPELNAPKNVTEYWKSDVLRAFIQDNSAFRYKSKMPVFAKMTSGQLDDLVAYLKVMKDHKIKSP